MIMSRARKARTGSSLPYLIEPISVRNIKDVHPKKLLRVTSSSSHVVPGANSY